MTTTFDNQSGAFGSVVVLSPQAQNHACGQAPRAGALIINADDWGRDAHTTDCTLKCIACGSVSSVSAMVFMQDSERAAGLAREQTIDAGLHLNFTERFSSPTVSGPLAEHQRRIASFLRRSRLSQVLYNPLLSRSFEYVARAQTDEYCRIYGQAPRRVDGHHHMHLCANVVFSRLLPSGTVVRRNFSFGPGEKSLLNRFYRSVIDAQIKKRHLMADYLFSLAPLGADCESRLHRISRLAQNAVVELETHPVNPEEFRFLTAGDLFCILRTCRAPTGAVWLGLKPA